MKIITSKEYQLPEDILEYHIDFHADGYARAIEEIRNILRNSRKYDMYPDIENLRAAIYQVLPEEIEL